MVEEGSRQEIVEGSAETQPQYRNERPTIPYMPEGWVPANKWNLSDVFSGDPAKAVQEVEKFLGKKIILNQKRGLSPEDAKQAVAERWGRTCMYGVMGEGLCISPDTIEALIESATLAPKIKGPPPSGWRNIESLQQEFAGGYEYMHSMLEVFPKQQVQRLRKEKEYTYGEAVNAVRNELIGFYLSGEPGDKVDRIYISPAAVTMLEESRKLVRKDRLAPEGWPSIWELQKKYIGNYDTLHNTIALFVRGKINEALAHGTPKDKAEKEVYSTWGNVFPQLGHPPSFHVSHAGEQEMVETGKLIARETVPPVPKNSKTAIMLASDYYGGRHAIRNKIKAFVLRKKKQLVGNGVTENAADKLVHDEWAGKYIDENGRNALYLTPQGEQELVASGDLVAKEKSPSIPEGWKSARMLEDIYDCDSSQIRRKMHQFLEAKRAELTKASLASDDIDRNISKDWDEFYRDPQGKKTMYISPAMESAMKESGMLVARDKTLNKAPQGWPSITQIGNTYAGSPEYLERKIVQFTAEKAQELAREMPREEAEKIAAARWSGIYRKRENRRSSLHASPETLTEMSEKQIIKPKHHLKTGDDTPAHIPSASWSAGEIRNPEHGCSKSNTYRLRAFPETIKPAA